MKSQFAIVVPRHDATDAYGSDAQSQDNKVATDSGKFLMNLVLINIL